MKVATHNGIFHADDTLALAILFLIVGSGMEILRTRDPKALAEADLRVDVGGKYDPAAGDFDHHQRAGAGTRENGIPLAAAGLIWAAYGWDAVSVIRPDLDPDEAARVVAIVDQILVQPVDAADSGFSLWREDIPARPYTLSHLVSAMNPGWDEDGDYDQRFTEAMELCVKALVREVMNAAGTVRAEALVAKAYTDRSDPALLVLEPFCPWQRAVFELELDELLYVVFPSPDGEWRVQAVPQALDSFSARRDLPEVWGGLRGKDLVEVTGVEDATFCHPGLFICGARSREGAHLLARIALSWHDGHS